MDAPRVSIVLPTWNGERDLARLLPALARQDLRGGFEIRAIDSGSTDGTVGLLENAGAHLLLIDQRNFRHGATRNLAARDARGEFLVFLSQDALPQDRDFLATLTSAFEDPKVAGSYASIRPHPDDDPLTARTVLAAPTDAFNNVASAIRTAVFREIPFPDVAFGEDVAWAREAQRAGWRIHREPRAVVLHSHRYSPRRAYARYKDDAAFHRELTGQRIRPSLWSVARGIGYEVGQDVGYVARHGGALHLLRSPFLRAAQVLGQYVGSR